MQPKAKRNTAKAFDEVDESIVVEAPFFSC
jgi:hypothetical protein